MGASIPHSPLACLKFAWCACIPPGVLEIRMNRGPGRSILVPIATLPKCISSSTCYESTGNEKLHFIHATASSRWQRRRILPLSLPLSTSNPQYIYDAHKHPTTLQLSLHPSLLHSLHTHTSLPSTIHLCCTLSYKHLTKTLLEYSQMG